MSVNISSKLAEKLKQYTACANDSVKLKFIHSEQDLNEESKASERSSNFAPEFTHQIFGDEEMIFGYKDLKVKYYLTPGALHAYIGLAYSEKITPQRFDGIEADDIYDAFSKFGCSPGFTRSLDTFTGEKLKQDYEFRPYGFKIHEYSREVRNPVCNNAAKKSMSHHNHTAKFEIFKVDSSCSEFHSQRFIDYLQRVQTMLVYYIEQASFVDTDDDQWTFFLLYEKRKRSQTGTNSGILSASGSNDRYVTVGYLSVYNYYAFPDKTRSRVSQMLIFPPYQRNGHGATLMEAVYMDACKNSKVLDVTAESPSDGFMQLRDYVTSNMCVKLAAFKNVDSLKKGYNEEMAKEALAAYKLPKLQSRRCYEILRLQFTNENNENEWRDYRIDVKKRLYKPFIQKNKFARNATTMSNDKGKEAEDKDKPSKLDSRLSGASGSTCIGFGSSSGASTTIGFGSGSGSGGGSTTIGFGAAKPAKGTKSVSFAKPAVNKSDEEDSDGYEEEEESENEMDVSANSQYMNLFMNEPERKKYLEEQFNQSVEDYRKTLRRLENQ